MREFADIFQRVTLLVCLAALAAIALGYAAYGIGDLLARLRRLFGSSKLQGLVAVAFIVGAIMYGGSKGVYVKWDDGLRDNGTLITNDTVSVVWTYSGIPSASSVFIDYREAGTTNNWQNLGETVASALSWTGTLANATNYDYFVYTTYIPPVPVHTNGVWEATVYETKSRVGAKAFIILNGKVEDHGRTIATPAAKRRDEHTYCRAGLLAMWDGINHGDNQLIWRDLSGNGYDATQRVANAGWRWDSDAYVGTMQNGHGFRTPLMVASAIRSNINGHTIEIVFKPGNTSRQTLFGQYSDSTGASGGMNIEYSPNKPGYFRAYYGAAPDVDTAAWKNGKVRMTCAVVCNGANLLLYENGVRKVTAAQPDASKVGVGLPYIIGCENRRSNMSIVGELCAVRIYGRALSESELEHNYEIDKERFNLP